MYDPSMRVLAVLELMQTFETVTNAQLAKKLEVSPRSVQRYIVRLQDMGIPIEGKRGVGGHYRLRAGHRIPPLMFSTEEALTLVLGLHALQHLGLNALAPMTETVKAKLHRVMPHTTREHIQTLEQTVQIGASPWVVNTDFEQLQLLLQAVRQHRVIQFSYTNMNQKNSLRTARPSHAIHIDGRWYVVAWCEFRQETRVFRLDRMQHLTLLETNFTPPAPFDALELVRGSLPGRPPSHRISVWLDAPPEDLRGKLSMWWGELSSEQGGTRLICERHHLEPFGAMLLGLGCPIRIDEPPALLEVFKTLRARCNALLEA
ncbi:MAG: YafY family transcriptional regulator [Pleurocapsa sp. SU_196_0]|nr:YafY family transcriptional regulator [Pleurocapsa sp. SU_196_0]